MGHGDRYLVPVPAPVGRGWDGGTGTLSQFQLLWDGGTGPFVPGAGGSPLGQVDGLKEQGNMSPGRDASSYP